MLAATRILSHGGRGRSTIMGDRPHISALMPPSQALPSGPLAPSFLGQAWVQKGLFAMAGAPSSGSGSPGLWSSWHSPRTHQGLTTDGPRAPVIGRPSKVCGLFPCPGQHPLSELGFSKSRKSRCLISHSFAGASVLPQIPSQETQSWATLRGGQNTGNNTELDKNSFIVHTHTARMRK